MWLLLLFSLPAQACGACRPVVMARIAAEPYWPTALLLNLPVLLILILAVALYRAGAVR
jgi:hypothetical protein